MPKLTPEQKAYKQRVDDWRMLRNRCASMWSFKKLQTYEDLLHHALGQDRESIRTYYSTDQLATTVDHQQVIDFFEPLKATIDWEYQQQNGSAWRAPEPFDHEYEGCTYSIAPTLESLSRDNKVDATTATEVEVFAPDSNRKQEDEHDSEVILHPSPKEKCFLFPFQQRAAKKILDGMLIYKKRGILLRAAVGTGKTFIVGAVARRLLDMGFCVGKTYSPWAMCWITRASIVEQTRRVLQSQFSIDTVNELQVINIEQLRSSFGELMVRSETIIERGEEHTIWKWRPNVHPIIFFIDESQFAKNEYSQQSEIIQAIADINSPHIYVICFSATPLLRACDAKYLVLNMRLQTKGTSMEVMC